MEVCLITLSDYEVTRIICEILIYTILLAAHWVEIGGGYWFSKIGNSNTPAESLFYHNLATSAGTKYTVSPISRPVLTTCLPLNLTENKQSTTKAYHSLDAKQNWKQNLVPRSNRSRDSSVLQSDPIRVPRNWIAQTSWTKLHYFHVKLTSTEQFRVVYFIYNSNSLWRYAWENLI
jgi:hypothetical protein